MIDEKLTQALRQESDADESLRPTRFQEFVGQDQVKTNLEVYVQAARLRAEAMDHVLLTGPPGLGKTTLAFILAEEMGARIRVTAAPAIEKQGDLMALLTNLQGGDILFIDEIHRLRRALEELLYSAMEDFRMDLVIGEGAGAKTLTFPIPKFTLVGATTRTGAISAPLRSRFGIVERLHFYTEEDLSRVILRSAHILHVALLAPGAYRVAQSARGTPRIANRLLRRVSDFALVHGESQIGADFVEFALDKLAVDALGLDEQDRKLLDILITHYQGGPAGLNTLATSLHEDVETVEDVIEPFLIERGLIHRTSRGRMATARAYKHLGFDVPAEAQELF